MNRKPAFVAFLVLETASAMVPLQAQSYGAVALDNLASGAGIYLFSPPNAAPAGTQVEVLAGPGADSLAPVLPAFWPGGPILTIAAWGENTKGPGSGAYFFADYARLPGVPPWGVNYFQVLAWLGGTDYETAPIRGSTPVWSQRVGEDHDGPPPGPPNPADLHLPGPIVMDFVPEPSTSVLGLLGIGALFRGCFKRHSWTAPIPCPASARRQSENESALSEGW